MSRAGCPLCQIPSIPLRRALQRQYFDKDAQVAQKWLMHKHHLFASTDQMHVHYAHHEQETVRRQGEVAEGTPRQQQLLDWLSRAQSASPSQLSVLAAGSQLWRGVSPQSLRVVIARDLQHLRSDAQVIRRSAPAHELPVTARSHAPVQRMVAYAPGARSMAPMRRIPRYDAKPWGLWRQALEGMDVLLALRAAGMSINLDAWCGHLRLSGLDPLLRRRYRVTLQGLAAHSTGALAWIVDDGSLDLSRLIASVHAWRGALVDPNAIADAYTTQLSSPSSWWEGSADLLIVSPTSQRAMEVATYMLDQQIVWPPGGSRVLIASWTDIYAGDLGAVQVAGAADQAGEYVRVAAETARKM